MDPLPDYVADWMLARWMGVTRDALLDMPIHEEGGADRDAGDQPGPGSGEPEGAETVSLLELRCERHLHMLFDPDTETVAVKCHWCTQWKKRPVFHDWPLREIVRRWHEGELRGVCAPRQAEQFVH